MKADKIKKMQITPPEYNLYSGGVRIKTGLHEKEKKEKDKAESL
jgi:hypothetical protein